MVKDLSSEKDKIRKKILSIRNNLPSSEVNKKSETICKKVLALDEIKKCQNVLAYLPIDNEVETKLIIDSLVQSDKKVFLPKFLNGKWTIVEFKNWNEIESGPFNILQPKENTHVDVNKIDIAIIPGVAFDKNGARLGFGKGVYDRLLKTFPNLKIGLAYEFQIIGSIPKEKSDLGMDWVLTENRTLLFNNYCVW